MTDHRFVYVAQPVDLASDSRSEIDSRLLEVNQRVAQELGHALRAPLFHPARAWEVVPVTPPTDALQAANLAVLDQASLLVVAISSHPSIGTVQEVVQAQNSGIPVAINTTRAMLDRSWSLQSLITGPHTCLGATLKDGFNEEHLSNDAAMRMVARNILTRLQINQPTGEEQ